MGRAACTKRPVSRHKMVVVQAFVRPKQADDGAALRKLMRHACHQKRKRKTRGIDSWWLGAQHFNSTHSGRSGYWPGLLRGQSLAGPSRRARAPVELTIIHQLWNPCALLKEKK